MSAISLFEELLLSDAGIRRDTDVRVCKIQRIHSFDIKITYENCRKTTIPASESEFTYENGIKTWVGALFVDIVNSSRLFQYANEDTARIIRSFCSEIISILKDDDNYREIGIRGDCVYCIYTTPYQKIWSAFFATRTALIPF